MARKKPRSPSRMRVAPVNPARARSAASTPFIAALPGCRCLLMAPSALNSHRPAACVPGAAERVEHLRGVQLNQRAGGRCRAERRCRAGGMPVAVMAGIDGFADAQRGFIA